MLSGLNQNVYVFNTAVDMRKSYDSLCGLVRGIHNILQGDVFLFISADRKRAKALFWDGSGLNIWMKRMERGRFANILERKSLTTSELKIFFEGSKQVSRPLVPQDKSKEFFI